MEITWLGHSCFRVRTRDAVIVMDPFSKFGGLDMGRPRADIVTVSHDHPGHSYTAGVKGNPEPKIVSGPGEYEISGIFITGIRTYHDAEQGAKHGKNTVYLLESESMTFAHLGDLGHALNDTQADLMSNVDILFVPVGGGNSLDPVKASEVITQIDPQVVIPMHFKTNEKQTTLAGVEQFCKEMGLTDWKREERLTIRKSDLAENTQVMVLAPRSV